MLVEHKHLAVVAAAETAVVSVFRQACFHAGHNYVEGASEVQGPMQ